MRAGEWAFAPIPPKVCFKLLFTLGKLTTTLHRMRGKRPPPRAGDGLQEATKAGVGLSSLVPSQYHMFFSNSCIIHLITEIQQNEQKNPPKGFSVRSCSAHSNHENTPDIGGFPLRCPPAHTEHANMPNLGALHVWREKLYVLFHFNNLY